MNGLPALVATIAFLFYPPFDNFAWNVQDRRSGLFLATGFLFRTALFIQVITAKSWGEIRWLTWGNAVFAAVLLGVTLIWGDLFHWRRWIAVVWLYLYIEEPIWMITLVPQAQAAASSALVPGGPVLLLTKLVLGIEAGIMLVAGLYLWFAPRLANPNWWPWKPDLVSGRVMAGFPLGWVAWALTLAAAPTWSEARGGVLVNLVWLAGMLLAVLVFRRQFDLRQRPVQIYTGVIAALFAAVGLVYLFQSA
jgi:hypothetical protein